MITIRLQLVLLALTIISLFILIRMIARYKLDLKYSLLWLLLGGGFIIFTIFPTTVYYIAKFLSIETPTNALFLLGILFLIAIVFSLTIAISNASNNIKKLSQELGVLKLELSKLKKFDKDNM
ncbi:DUF2304 domain-containing protein [Lysinibacillus telephonicus]|uniref:DUF2304 domain-containing protein n=1 Tax=Lysinibacillus telephonicus TaxID=1714840 RepID=A0A431URZ0_9BACI|nr:DUF2304 domain-containing protein [Lysinibacillus telephonicus]RTQ93156.1 DUF2304 domain-containing protein [Lysinibacillus telephonicus]